MLTPQAIQAQLVQAGLNPAPREGQALWQAAAGDATHLQALVAQRLTGKPLAYVLGFQPFWSRDWRVGPGVLIPRPDSEILLQAVLDFIPVGSAALIAEVGVGSGALLGSVLLERPQVTGLGTDISPVALEVARANFTEAAVMARANLQQTDKLMGISGPFDVVLSNPPYISAADYAALENSVRGWEPEVALVGGTSGLEFYAALLPQALMVLRAGGLLAAEIGHTQGPAVAAMFAEVGFTAITVLPDLAGRPRVVRGYKATE